VTYHVGMSKIVVGVDGSDASRAAVRWAADEARLRGVALHAVEAWEFSPLIFAADVPVALDELRRTVTEHLHAVVSDEVADGVDVTELVVEKAPVAALLDQCGPDDVLVVGSRGRGGFAGLLLGSVSQQLAQHSTCPVVIVRPPQD
jgi:nucleotide-binding universal stress UspA family protein